MNVLRNLLMVFVAFSLVACGSSPYKDSNGGDKKQPPLETKTAPEIKTIKIKNELELSVDFVVGGNTQTVGTGECTSVAVANLGSLRVQLNDGTIICGGHIICIFNGKSNAKVTKSEETQPPTLLIVNDASVNCTK